MEVAPRFRLGESALLFVPIEKSQTETPHVTSIYLYDATAPSSTRTKEQVTAKYALEKQVIGEILTKLAIQNIRQPFPPLPFVVHGNGYELHCALKPWPYGEKLGLGWGKMELQASEEKWQVGFVVKD
ncbi:hypothetical protein EWM64_g9063 [Hericium alpestre]|uniref:Uncharacterized protein n=1 Tax=Hericium alpestre TaxID=135208 RepID=A0A4Y9ZJH2_9AGAM|nr:hypothetical protein EWM64_g9063 [Hericium alpestre]